jgi:L-arginine dehydrogenase
MNILKHSDHEVAPMLLTAEEIRTLIPKINVKEVLTQTFLSLSHGNAIQPPQSLSLFAQDKGDFITYTGAINELDVFGAKLSPYLVTSAKPVVTAWTYLMSQRTGQPLLCCDSGLLTVERTAGTTALAVAALARANSQTLSIIGSGAIALAHLQHVLMLRNWQDVRVYSPNIAKNIERQNAFKAVFPEVVFSNSASEACENTDVIMLCTSSGTPVIELKDIVAGVLVTSISTNVANAHEVPAELLSRSDVYCDYKSTAPSVAGEMKIASENGRWSSEQISGDLAELMRKTCMLPTFDKPIFFRSVGLGLEDIAIAYGVWSLLQHESK